MSRSPRPLTVLSVAFPLAEVSPDAVGGSEQVLSHLDAALTRAGHRSLVLACEGSAVTGTLIPSPRFHDGPLDDQVRWHAEAIYRDLLDGVLREHAIDLIHIHAMDFLEYLPPPGVPVLATVHLPPMWYPAAAFAPDRPDTWLNCVSLSQEAACPAGARLVPHIPNGVPHDKLLARHGKRRFALMLARVCPEKGIDIGLDAAKRADMPMLIGGELFRYAFHENYFENEVRPRLDARRRFLGPVGFARKRRLLTAAQCLLVPSLAPETSSLVAMEAACCGTAVVAHRAGALPEIVEHGRTGFLVDSVEEMAEAMEAARDLDPEEIRAVAAERFSLERMVGRYLDLYQQIVSSRGAGLGQVSAERLAG